MGEEVSLNDYYREIDVRGWATWIHTPSDGFTPKALKGWERRTEQVSADRQVTVTWDPTRFSGNLDGRIDREQHEMVEIYRSADYRMMLFPVTS